MKTYIQMRPSHMKRMVNKASPQKKPLFKSLDCPKGTVPIRRTRREDLISANSLASILRKEILQIFIHLTLLQVDLMGASIYGIHKLLMASTAALNSGFKVGRCINLMV